MIKLIRFWFRFIPSEKIPSTIQLGCGVTAYSYEDAVLLSIIFTFTKLNKYENFQLK